MNYISKCIKQQGIYATAALAPLLNKLVEKVFKNTEDLEKLASSGANGGVILQFVAYLEDRPIDGGEIPNALIYRLTNTQEEVNRFLDAVQGEANSIITDQQTGADAITIRLSRRVGDSGAIIKFTTNEE